jgi:hypothetical protein
MMHWHTHTSKRSWSPPSPPFTTRGIPQLQQVTVSECAGRLYVRHGFLLRVVRVGGLDEHQLGPRGCPHEGLFFARREILPSRRWLRTDLAHAHPVSRRSVPFERGSHRGTKAKVEGRALQSPPHLLMERYRGNVRHPQREICAAEVGCSRTRSRCKLGSCSVLL